MVASKVFIDENAVEVAKLGDAKQVLRRKEFESK